MPSPGGGSNLLKSRRTLMSTTPRRTDRGPGSETTDVRGVLRRESKPSPPPHTRHPFAQKNSRCIMYRQLVWQRDRASLLYIQTNLSYCEHSSPKSASKFAHNPTYCRVIQGAGCNPSVHPLALVPLCRIRSAMSATKIDVHGLDDIVDAL